MATTSSSIRKSTMTVHKTTIYEVNGQPIHVHEEGPPGNPVAVLVHGWSSSWYAISPLLPTLNSRFRCLAVDLPGYGKSPPLPERATIDGYVDLLATLIRETRKQPIVLVGHSMGGMIGITLALHHPALIERMILLCPTISGDLSLFIKLFMSPFVLMERFSVSRKLVELLEPQMLNVTDRLLRPALFADRSGITREEYEHIRADARRPGQGLVRAECFEAMRNHDLRGKLGQIETPALVIWGMEDNTVPLRDASVVAQEWPDADLRVIPNAGHWPQFETPATTERYVRAFLGTPSKLLKFMSADLWD
jgi:pimeloyl-ACP methyl ester carboxylesterase